MAGQKRRSLLRPFWTRTVVDAMPASQNVHSVEAALEIEKELLGTRERPSALCLSGGGIRSASFSLGVLQALASAGLLTRFDYLSTVSGGGFIGGWLQVLIQRKGPA